jgi:peptidoglycan/xylan/chitin deacetylase (PgdA/CDA1 family)
VNNGDSTSDIYSIPRGRFKRGVQALSNIGGTSPGLFIPFSSQPTPGIAITFDDGYAGIDAFACETLNDLDIPFHLFLTKSLIQSGEKRYLNEDSVRKLATLPGIGFGIHGSTHDRMTSLPEVDLRRALIDSRDWLEQLIQRPVASLSYPHGAVNSSVERIVAESGFDCAANSRPGTFTLESQRFAIPRIDIWSLDTPRTYIHKALGSWDRFLP